MNEAKFTPGRWLRQDTTVYSLEHAGWKKGEELHTNRFWLSVQRGPTISDDELGAVVRLIAAAPDLYEALYKIELAASFCAVPAPRERRELDRALDAARAALAKAIQGDQQ
jgi:hypothetical protein